MNDPRRADTVFPLLLLIGGAMLPGAAAAARGEGQAHGETASPSAAGATAEAGDIVVTGRAAPGSVIGDIPAENRLGPADIAGYGVGTINELLDQLTEQTRSDQGRDADSGPVVLVNGKRISGIDEIGDLPSEAILRVDILPEEVALRYGYDAQRKVVNVILHRRVRSTIANVGAGRAVEGQGENALGDVTYTRIDDNDRINVAARVQGAASLLESERGLTPATMAVGSGGDPAGGGDGAYRTLRPRTRNWSLNGTYGHRLSDTIAAALNLRGGYATSAALQGLPDAVDADGGGVGFGGGLVGGLGGGLAGAVPLHQDATTATAHVGATVNADLSTMWRLSLIAAYDHVDARTGTDRGYDAAIAPAAIDGEDSGVDRFGVLPGAVAGPRRGSRARSLSDLESDTGSASVLVTGRLFRLPAGAAHGSVRVGGDVDAVRATTRYAGGVTATSADRTDTDAQVSIDLPLASRRTGFLSAIGTLSANVNAATTHVSGYGTLGTTGAGLNWTPRRGISVIAAINEDRRAPTLTQLDAPRVTGSARVYDYATGETVTVTRSDGGNPALVADDRHVMKIGLTARPLRRSNLSLSATYINSVTRDPIVMLAGVTAAAQAAFPDRYTRDAGGTLVAIDSRPVNVARERRELLRWGLNFTGVLRAPVRPAPPWARTGVRPPPPGGEAPVPGRRRAPDGEEGVPVLDERAAARAGAGGSDDGGSDQDIVVEGRRQQPDGDDGPPPGGDGMGPPDGPPPDGPPPDGRAPDSPPPGGFGGAGGPPGGPGFGGPGGGPGGFGGGDNGARLQVSIYHSWLFRDEVLLRDGGEVVDLLDGGTIGDGGRARHSVQVNAGVTDNGIGIRLTGSWKGAATVSGDTGSGTGDLRFAALATFDLRLFADLDNRVHGRRWTRGTRVSFAIGNILGTRPRVTDATGATPLVYQPAYLDPYGRTVSLSVRRVL